MRNEHETCLGTDQLAAGSQTPWRFSFVMAEGCRMATNTTRALRNLWHGLGSGLFLGGHPNRGIPEGRPFRLTTSTGRTASCRAAPGGGNKFRTAYP